ncbi:MAG: hypothetical protein ACFFB0_19870 [Promethearchaeota archaeon]
MTEINEKSREEYEKKIERLKYENQNLKLRIAKLEQENSSLKEKISHIEKADIALREKPTEIEAKTTISVREVEKPGEMFKKVKEEVEPIILETQFEEIEKKGEVETPLKDVRELLYEQAPPDLEKKPIVEGYSRRVCPICSNTNKMQIHEIIDRNHIISDYPRMYGKKYRCGSCGREWRLSSTSE